MTARIWLRDRVGVWLADVMDESGALIADVAHMPGCTAPVGAQVRIEGSIERGESLVTVRSTWWTLVEDVPVGQVTL